MSEIKLKNGRIIGNREKPYIVAEMNSSHNGKTERARQMMDAAKACGCDCVKFQSWTENTLYSEEYYAQNPISRRLVKGFSLNENQLYELWEYSREIGIDFSSTPYSEKEVDFLADRIEVPFIKIASMEINNPLFLEYIAKKGIPIILSTGMASYEEIDQAASVIINAGNTNLCILHCISVYPAEPDSINLNNLVYLKEKYPEFVIGYSDHTMGDEIACGAVALGAGVIEKHFTMDSSRMGMDNNMATEPEEMKALVHKCHNVHAAMGRAERLLSEKEKSQLVKMRRSIVAKSDLKAGTVLEAGMLDYKRPGTGLPPMKRCEVVGKRLKRAIKKGFFILKDDIE
ncbi:N-acetylneuraminate synthase family protein [Lachnospiraceae bacterium 48-42]